MASRRGAFIVIEGTDGSGKGTQCQLLHDRLQQAGYDVATFDFPQYDQPSSYFVSQYLNGAYGSAQSVGPYTASLFYALDRYEAAPKIREALEQGKIVISNRFTGSSMAHQGTKFRNAEERRGYFIWLDNLEFEMLRIPRPDISFILRVPADIAQQLVDKKPPRAYTDKKRDLHEADLNHLEQTVEVFDDMAQLFPKDFQRVDCVRSGKLQDIETVQALLWEKISPLLPQPPQLEMPLPAASTAHTSAAIPPVATKQTVAPHASPEAQPEPTANINADTKLVYPNASSLLADRISACQPAIHIQQAGGQLTYRNDDGSYRYYTPDYLEPALQATYKTHLDHIFDLYHTMVQQLTTYLAAQVRATELTAAQQQAIQSQVYHALRPVLPVASATTIDVYTSGQSLKRLIAKLLQDALPEARQAGRALLAKARQAQPDVYTTLENVIQNTAQAKVPTDSVDALARSYLPEAHSAATEPTAQLVDAWPRNELDIVPDMLYPHSGLPLQAIRSAVDSWPYTRKLAVFEAAISAQTLQPAPFSQPLQSIRYSWDFLDDYHIVRDLQLARATGNAERQLLTPRYGYAMPPLIDEAGLSDEFEQCFELSLSLYSLLQEAGYPLEAQYATLLGHRMRWKASYSYHQTAQLYRLRHEPDVHPNTRLFLQRMQEKLAEVHPLLAEVQSAVSQ